MASDKGPDRLDREILRLIASYASLSLADIASRVGLTPTPCWKRIRPHGAGGCDPRRVAVIDPAKVGCRSRCSSRSRPPIIPAGGSQSFDGVVATMPEIVDAWRMSGDVDYLLHVVVPDIAGPIRRLLSPPDRRRAAAQRHHPLLHGAAQGRRRCRSERLAPPRAL